MIIKERNRSVSHQILKSLNERMTLSQSDQANFEAQVKGFEGETIFDVSVNEANLPGLILCDLTLSTKETVYQIDALYVSDNELIIYEIKNYTGHYIYKDGLMYSDNGFVLQDPLAQVRRKQSYLHNLMLSSNQSVKVTSYVVFINFDFYIYLLPKTKQIVFAGQLKNHLVKLAKASKAPSSKGKKIADKVLGLHLENFRPANLPNYTFNQLKKGIYCNSCSSWNCSASRQFLICPDCQFIETIPYALKRTLDEFKLLFPDEKLTLETAKSWAGTEWSGSRIRRVLKTNYALQHSGRSSHYK